jgi:hypothetical protein
MKGINHCSTGEITVRVQTIIGELVLPHQDGIYLSNLDDPCVFTRVTGDEAFTILLYVDDLMIISDSDAPENIHPIFVTLLTFHWSMSWLNRTPHDRH